MTEEVLLLFTKEETIGLSIVFEKNGIFPIVYEEAFAQTGSVKELLTLEVARLTKEREDDVAERHFMLYPVRIGEKEFPYALQEECARRGIESALTTRNHEVVLHRLRFVLPEERRELRQEVLSWSAEEVQTVERAAVVATGTMKKISL